MSSAARARATSSPSVEGGALQQDSAIDAHGERRADRLLGGIPPETIDHRFAGTGGFLELERLFQRVLVVGIGDELDPVLVYRLAVAGDDDLGRGIGDALETDRNTHSATSR